jgi:hypothetical protein
MLYSAAVLCGVNMDWYESHLVVLFVNVVFMYDIKYGVGIMN